MSAAKCQCMGPGSAPPLSMGMASRQFSQPPCPCIKCKDRARDRHEAQIQAVANNKSGICGQCVKGMMIGKPPGMGAGVGPGSSAREQPCSCPGHRMGTGMGPGMGPGMCPGMGPGMGPRMGPRLGPGMGPGMGPCMRPATGAGSGPGRGPGMGPGRGIAMGTGMGPGMGPVVGTSMGTGMGPGMGPGMGTAMGTGMGPGMGPGMATAMGTGMGHGMGPVMTRNQGCSPLKPESSNSPKCQCEGAKMGADMGPFGPEQDSGESSGIAFGGQIVLRKSSMTESGYQINELPMLRSGCAGNLDYGDNADDRWQADRFPSIGGVSGRDTFGLPILLQGNTGILNTGSCRANVSCDKHCGMDTGCNAGCAASHSGAAGGKGFAGDPHRAMGLHVCSNEYINMIITFLMEVLGILVFFSICTITFWITLGYYIVQLLIDLKNAERNVHVAVGIVFSLLILAFAITLVTHTDGSCRNRAMALRKGIESSATTSISSCKKCTKAATAAAKRTCASKCKLSSKPTKLKPTSPTKPPKSSKLLPPKPHAVKCKSVCQKHTHKKLTPTKPKKLARSYTDCQGRAIFDRSRRNSILIEMKQPPTWLIWLRDNANEFFNRQ